MKRCIVCREPYYRRNMTERWLLNASGKWVKYVAKGHPSCLRILNSVTKMFAERVA
jgi:hypothetical protein